MQAAEDSLHRLYLTRTPSDMLCLPSDAFSEIEGLVYGSGDASRPYVPGELGEVEVIYASKDRHA